ncbi:protein of unknown function [Burkholderia multivorans]
MPERNLRFESSSSGLCLHQAGHQVGRQLSGIGAQLTVDRTPESSPECATSRCRTHSLARWRALSATFGDRSMEWLSWVDLAIPTLHAQAGRQASLNVGSEPGTRPDFTSMPYIDTTGEIFTPYVAGRVLPGGNLANRGGAASHRS